MRAYLNGLGSMCLAALVTALVACSSHTDTDAVDLPAGWSGALYVADLVQVECATSELILDQESATFIPGKASLGVNYDQAHFRCEQDVEGFYKISGQALDMLVQPIDMHPDTVASCDCAFGITFTVRPLTSGQFQATLYRRWDAINTPNNPVQIATEQVTIE